MVAPVDFRPLLSFRKHRFAIPPSTRLAPAWRFLSWHSPLLSKNTMLHKAIAEMLHLLTFFISSAAKSPPATHICARPRSRRLRCDFCCTSPCVFACRRKNLHCAACPLRSPGRARRRHSQRNRSYFAYSL
jgi:hypothetical protein